MLAETVLGRPADIRSEEPSRPVGKYEGGKTKRVLLVDDHDLFRQVLVVVLERHAGLDENLQAASIAEARTIVDGHDDDLLALAVVDVGLPDGDVRGLIGELRRRNVPVLAITPNEKPARSTGAHEADEMITTAASSDDIFGAARRLVGGQ